MPQGLVKECRLFSQIFSKLQSQWTMAGLLLQLWRADHSGPQCHPSVLKTHSLLFKRTHFHPRLIFRKLSRFRQQILLMADFFLQAQKDLKQASQTHLNTCSLNLLRRLRRILLRPLLHRLWQRRSCRYLVDHIVRFRSMAWLLILEKWSQITKAWPEPHIVFSWPQQDLQYHQATHLDFLRLLFLQASFLATPHQSLFECLFYHFFRSWSLHFSSSRLHQPRLFFWSFFYSSHNLPDILFVRLETFEYSTKAFLAWEFALCFSRALKCRQLP